jgi:hypothetical protein
MSDEFVKLVSPGVVAPKFAQSAQILWKIVSHDSAKIILPLFLHEMA